MDVHKVGVKAFENSLMLPMSNIIELKTIVTFKMRNILHCWWYVDMLCIYHQLYPMYIIQYWKETKVDKLCNVNDYIYICICFVFNEWSRKDRVVLIFSLKLSLINKLFVSEQFHSLFKFLRFRENLEKINFQKI